MQPGDLPHRAEVVVEKPEAEPETWSDKSRAEELRATSKAGICRDMDGASREVGNNGVGRIQGGTGSSKRFIGAS